MGKAGKQQVWLLEVGRKSVVAVAAALVLLLALVPGRVGSEIKHTRGLEGQQLARGSSQPHQRLKRGWVWKPLFILEEDPVPQIIGQVPVAASALNVLHVLDAHAALLKTARFPPHFTCFSGAQIKSDSDRGDRSIKYVLSGEGAGELFEIDERNGDIRMLKRLDREEKAFYVLQAQAVNRHSNQPEEPQSEFIITVQDINDNRPQFHNEPYMASIPEMCPTGKVVAVWLLFVNSTTTVLTPGRNFCTLYSRFNSRFIGVTGSASLPFHPTTESSIASWRYVTNALGMITSALHRRVQIV